MIIVCDSSPIVALAACDKLDLLDKLFDKVFIPNAVFRELSVPGKLELQKITIWAQTKIAEVKNKHLVQAFNLILDIGESEAMALYWEKEADYLLIDEKKGRKIATYNGQKVVGTLGVLLLAKQKGFLNAVKPLIDLLKQLDIRISDELYEKTLWLAKE